MAEAENKSEDDKVSFSVTVDPLKVNEDEEKLDTHFAQLFSQDSSEDAKLYKSKDNSELDKGSKPRKSKEMEEDIRNKHGDVALKCDICGATTTYKDLLKHRKTSKEHKLKLEAIKREKQHKIKVDKQEPLEEETEKIECKPTEFPAETAITDNTYYPQWYGRTYGLSSLPELHQNYLIALVTLYALRYSFDKNRRDFRLSVINSTWKEFGDIVIEFYIDGNLDEIEAIQCKQIYNQNDISISTIMSDLGKFSLKANCKILKKLRNKRNFDQTTFIFYTVSVLAVNKDNFRKCTYDKNVVKHWKDKEGRKEWKDREMIIPENKKMVLANTTDDPDDVFIFRVEDSKNKEVMNNYLSKFRMLTNQAKLKDLKQLIKQTLEEKFEKCKHVSKDLVLYVREYFKNILQNQISHKLSKNNFLAKVTELLLTGFIHCPQKITKDERLKLWNDLTNSFNVVIIKNQADILYKIFAAMNNVLYDETGYSTDFNEITVKRTRVLNEKLNLELFNSDGHDVQVVTLQDMCVKLWKAELTPLVLATDNENDLNLIIKVIKLLHKNKVGLKFIIMTNLKVDRIRFPKTLKVFHNLKDLDNDSESFGNLLNIRIKMLNVSLLLKEIVEHNTNFLENNPIETVLNMLLDDYTFKNVNVGLTKDIIDNTLVLSGEVLGDIKRDFSGDERQQKNLSYIVSLNGKPVNVKIPPQL